MANGLMRRHLLKIIAGLPFMLRPLAGRFGCGAAAPPASVPASRAGPRTKAGINSAAKWRGA